MMVYLKKIIALFLLCTFSGVSSDIIVTLPNGQVNGTLLQSNFSSYYGFMGIPYAQPPVGTLRFQAPQAAEPWDGILDATAQKLSCVTSNYATDYINESEDCLYVNVFTPNLQPLIKLPVIFWIYGGGFQFGSSNTDIYGPDFLIAENVVFVSFNYRLGPLGFLSTGDEQIPGNNGLKDQNLALQWTKANIGYFGGDPNKVTIFGESAGAASVGLHMLSEKSAGLFRAGIMDSSSSLNVWTVQVNPAALFNEYVALLPGYILESSTLGVVGALQQQSVESLILASTLLPETNSVFNFVPVIEVPNENAFLTAYHYQLLQTGAYNNVPVLMGINTEEGSSLIGTTSNLLYFANMYYLTPETLIPPNLMVNDSNKESAISAIQQMYLTGDGTFLSNLTAVVKYFGDNIIVRSCLKQAELLSYFSPVYLYEFDYYGSRHLLSRVSVPGTGNVSHSDELPYLFYSYYAYSTNAGDVLTQNRMVKLWTNFVKYLIPTPVPSSLLNNSIWLPYNNLFRHYLRINTKVELKTNLRTDIMNEWDNIFETYGETPFNTY